MRQSDEKSSLASKESKASSASSERPREGEDSSSAGCCGFMGINLLSRKGSKKEAAAPQPSRVPRQNSSTEPPVDDTTRPSSRPTPTPAYPPVYLRLEPATLPGCSHFLRTCPDFVDTMASHHDTIFSLLYAQVDAVPPNVAAVTIVIRSMPGVAHTHGSPVVPNGHEIHCSAEYFADKPAAEIYGVLLHELVHVWQYNGLGSAPGGFIEGVADFVRLRGGLGAAHWRKLAPGKDDKWDSGYERTGYFLDWLDTERARGAVATLNSQIRNAVWGDYLWEQVGAKHGVNGLWKEYKASFGKEPDAPSAPPAKPTHAVV